MKPTRCKQCGEKMEPRTGQFVDNTNVCETCERDNAWAAHELQEQMMKNEIKDHEKDFSDKKPLGEE